MTHPLQWECLNGDGRPHNGHASELCVFCWAAAHRGHLHHTCPDCGRVFGRFCRDRDCNSMNRRCAASGRNVRRMIRIAENVEALRRNGWRTDP